MYHKSKQHVSRADSKDCSSACAELVVPSCVSRVVAYPLVQEGYERTRDLYQSRVRKSNSRVVRGLVAASEAGVGLSVGVGCSLLRQGQRRMPAVVGNRLKQLDQLAVAGLSVLEDRFPIITQDSDKVWQQASNLVDELVLKKANAFVDGKVKPNVERLREQVKAGQEKLFESPALTSLLQGADSAFDSLVPPDAKEEAVPMQQANGTPSNTERAKHLTSKVAHRLQNRFVRVRSNSCDSVRAAYSDLKRNWDHEYERAVEEEAPCRQCIGDGEQKELRNSQALVQQTRAVGKALLRTMRHYSDLSYAELVRLVQRAAHAFKSPASTSSSSSSSASASNSSSNQMANHYGALGAFLNHLLAAPLAIARNPLVVLKLEVRSGAALRNGRQAEAEATRPKAHADTARDGGSGRSSHSGSSNSVADEDEDAAAHKE